MRRTVLPLLLAFAFLTLVTACRNSSPGPLPAPVAAAGSNVTASTGELVRLDGSASAGTELSYSWEFTDKPSGSSASLSGADTATPQFVIDETGDYVLELTVSNAVASDSARVTITGSDDPGQLSPTVYVADSGSDGNPGTEAEPFRTPARALEAAAAGDGISRIRFAAGTYAVPAAGLLITKNLQLIGPEAGAGQAVLESPADLFSVEPAAAGGISATFVHLMLEAPEGTAVRARHGATISFTGVGCTAETCLSSAQQLLRANRGRVNVRDSTLQGNRRGTGIAVSAVTELQVTDSSLSSFQNGISASASGSLAVRETGISDSSTAIRLSTVMAAVISGSTVSDSVRGLSSSGSRDVEVHGSSITTSGSQVEVDRGGSLLLQGVTLESEDASPSIVIGANRSAGELVRISGSTIRGGAAGGIRVAGKSSILNLGTETEPGNNEVSGGPAPLFDDRPDGATGVVVTSGTALNGNVPPAGQYRGPLFSEGILISGDNLVIVY